MVVRRLSSKELLEVLNTVACDTTASTSERMLVMAKVTWGIFLLVVGDVKGHAMADDRQNGDDAEGADISPFQAVQLFVFVLQGVNDAEINPFDAGHRVQVDLKRLRGQFPDCFSYSFKGHMSSPHSFIADRTLNNNKRAPLA